MNKIININKLAIDVQDACNLSGVVHSFADVCSNIMQNGGNSNTIKNNPAVILFVDKITNMIGEIDFKKYNESYEICKNNS